MKHSESGPVFALLASLPATTKQAELRCGMYAEGGNNERFAWRLNRFPPKIPTRV
jgi:hypothetical protein